MCLIFFSDYPKDGPVCQASFEPKVRAQATFYGDRNLGDSISALSGTSQTAGFASAGP